MRITTNKQTSKTLKEMGFPQSTNYFWCGDEDNNGRFNLALYDTSETMDSYAAPTTDEILKLLPERIEVNDLSYGFRLWFVDMSRYVRHYCCNYFVMNYGKQGRLMNDGVIIEQEAVEAIAKMWMYCKINKFI